MITNLRGNVSEHGEAESPVNMKKARYGCDYKRGSIILRTVLSGHVSGRAVS